MGELFDRIRLAVEEDRVVIGNHADNRLRERRIPVWQVVAGIHEAHLIAERLQSKPNPSIEVEQLLPDGTAVKAVWSWLRYNEHAKLVTVHYYDD